MTTVAEYWGGGGIREFRVSEVRANHQRTEHLIGLKPPSACYFLAFNHFFKKNLKT